MIRIMPRVLKLNTKIFIISRYRFRHNILIEMLDKSFDFNANVLDFDHPSNGNVDVDELLVQSELTNAILNKLAQLRQILPVRAYTSVELQDHFTQIQAFLAQANPLLNEELSTSNRQSQASTSILDLVHEVLLATSKILPVLREYEVDVTDLDLRCSAWVSTADAESIPGATFTALKEAFDRCRNMLDQLDNLSQSQNTLQMTELRKRFHDVERKFMQLKPNDESSFVQYDPIALTERLRFVGPLNLHWSRCFVSIKHVFLPFLSALNSSRFRRILRCALTVVVFAFCFILWLTYSVFYPSCVSTSCASTPFSYDLARLFQRILSFGSNPHARVLSLPV